MKNQKKTLCFLVVFLMTHLQFLPLAAAQNGENISLRKEDPSQKTGSIYYSGNKKNELVIRTNIWGAVQFPGVHYVPIGTRFLDAISIAGGPVDTADLSRVTLTTKSLDLKEMQIQTLDLQKSLSQSELNPILKPDDIIVIRQDRSRETTQLWLSIGTFIISVAALGLLIDSHNKK